MGKEEPPLPAPPLPDNYVGLEGISYKAVAFTVFWKTEGGRVQTVIWVMNIGEEVN